MKRVSEGGAELREVSDGKIGEESDQVGRAWMF